MQKQPQLQKENAFLSKEISNVEADIEMYKDFLEDDEDDHNTQNLLGKAYQKLATLKKDTAFNTLAINAFTKAISLDPENALYVVDRAKLYATIQESELAVGDFQRLQELQTQNKGKSLMNDLMVKRTLKELAKLDSIKNTVKSLRARGALPRDFLDAFDELSNITRRLVVQVAHHTEQINKLNVLVEEILVKLQKGEVTSQEVEKLKEEVDKQKDEVKRIDKILTLSGVRDRVALKEKFDTLKTQNPKLYTYANTFYWTALNMFGAYRLLKSGIITPEKKGSESESIIVEGVKKIVSAGVTVGKALPFVGGVFEYTDNAIDYVIGWFKGKNTESKVNIINKILRAKFPFEDDISLVVARISLVMIMNPNKIDYIQRNPSSTSSAQGQGGNPLRNMYNRLCEFAENVKRTWWPGLKEDEDSFVTSQAVQDVTLLIAYLCVNSEQILQEDSPFEIQMETLLTQDKFDKMLAQMGTAGKCVCGEFYVPREGGALSQCSKCSSKSKGGVKCPKSSCKTKICITCYNK